MNPIELARIASRRLFLRNAGGGIGMMALADLLGAAEVKSGEAPNPLAPRKPHFPAKAKSVIFLFMEGGPSQMDLFDPKPELQKWHGKSLPASMTKDLKLAFIKPTAAVLASPASSSRMASRGMVFSDYLPHTAQVGDDLCMVRSMHTDAFNHHPGQLLLFTGSRAVRASDYGRVGGVRVGQRVQESAGLCRACSGVGTSGGASNFTSGFLPSAYQGTMLRSSGDPILYLSNPESVTREQQRAALDVVRDLNQERLTETGDTEIASRIASYELAFRMQTAGPELMDFRRSRRPRSRCMA